MARNRSRVKIDYPQGSETHYGKDVTVETCHEKPKVRVGGGDIGFDLSGEDLLFGAILFIVLLLGLGYLITEYVVHPAETLYKKIDPTYKTSFEVAEERAKAKEEERREEEKKKREDEEKREAQKPENRMAAAMWQQGYDFDADDVFALSNNIWGVGQTKKNNHYYIAVVCSSDNGKTYKLLSLVGKAGINWPSQIVFLDEKEGFLVHAWMHAQIYKTCDGGENWKMVLTTTNMSVYPSRCGASLNNGKSIDAKKIQGVSMIKVKLGEGFVESWGDCEKWMYIKDNTKAAETSNGGKTWKVFSEELLPGCMHKE